MAESQGFELPCDEEGTQIIPSKQEAFEDFKRNKGSEINRILMENKEILSNKRQSYRDLAKIINVTKCEIDETRGEIEKKKSNRIQEGFFVDESEEAVISEVEFVLMKKLRNLKSSYRSDYGDLENLKLELQYCKKQVDMCRQRLVQEFDVWYSEYFPSVEMTGYSSNIQRIEDEDDHIDIKQLPSNTTDPEAVAFYNAKLRTERRHIENNITRQPQPQYVKKRGVKTSSGQLK